MLGQVLDICLDGVHVYLGEHTTRVDLVTNEIDDASKRFEPAIMLAGNL